MRSREIRKERGCQQITSFKCGHTFCYKDILDLSEGSNQTSCKSKI